MAPIDFMRRALELAELGRGRTSPNPMVGAVVVKAGRIVGEGYHPCAGGPHAEVFALREAGVSARGATLFVNLEPCCHTGKRTPPCVPAVIESGIAEVHAAMIDPNPSVAGTGVAQLAAAGIRTLVGELEAEARAMNEVFTHWIATRTPFVVANARADATEGLARTSHLDAVLVAADMDAGAFDTLVRRLRSGRATLRTVVVDRDASLRADSPLAVEGALVVSIEAGDESRARDLARRGVELAVVAPSSESFTPSSILRVLGDHGITGVLLDGDDSLVQSFHDAGLVNRTLGGENTR